MIAAQAKVFSVTEFSEVGEARRQVAKMAQGLGFSDTRLGKLALIVTEAAGNLVKHATRGGELLVRVIEQGDMQGIEVLALDRAPGMSNLKWGLQDGHSTAGSPGTGLGAISRLADEFQIHSAEGFGTGVLARLWSRSSPAPLSSFLEIGVVSVPYPGEEVCGDGWAVSQRPGRGLLLVIDGLGHGFGAAEASRAAARAFQAHQAASPGEMIQLLHTALHGTRGAAAAVIEIDVEKRSACFAGIGNISGSINSLSRSQSMISHHGILGHHIRKVQEFTYEWPTGALLVLHSDGLTERWDLDRYKGLRARAPSLIAGILYRDFARRTDDATVLVAREAVRR